MQPSGNSEPRRSLAVSRLAPYCILVADILVPAVPHYLAWSRPSRCSVIAPSQIMNATGVTHYRSLPTRMSFATPKTISSLLCRISWSGLWEQPIRSKFRRAGSVLICKQQSKDWTIRTDWMPQKIHGEQGNTVGAAALQGTPNFPLKLDNAVCWRTLFLIND